MEALRHWSVRHARGLKRLYDACARTAPYFAPLMRQIGPARTERLLAPLERATKGFLFDCQMCGQCALSSTGMSCPMNCPKNLRNGPCGGVRENGHCEVKPEMKCVWAQGWAGAASMGLGDPQGHKIFDVQKAVDNRFKGKSSWLRVVRVAKGLEDEAGNKPKPAAAKPAPKPAGVADSLAGGKSTASPTPPGPPTNPAPSNPAPTNPGKAA